MSLREAEVGNKYLERRWTHGSTSRGRTGTAPDGGLDRAS